MKAHRFNFICALAILCLAIPVHSASEHTSGPFRQYPRQSAPVISQTTPVETPSPMSKRTQSQLVGSWTCVVAPVVSGDQLRSLVFGEDGTFRYDFEESRGGKVQSRRATYSVFHRGAVGRYPGKAPIVLISGDDVGVDQVIPLVDVSVDYDSRFPMSSGKRLRFIDTDGNEYILLRDATNATLSRSDEKPESADVEPGATGAAKSSAKEGRVVNPSLTREICARLHAESLTESERNKEIVRLMNKGDATCVPILIEHLGTNHSLVVRQNAIRALGKVGDRRAVPRLMDILRMPVRGNTADESEDEAILRRKAVVALGEIGDPTALPVLKVVADSVEEYQSVRDLARIRANKLESR